MELHYLIGDATEPVNKPCLICHICNDIGAWGAGFVMALSAKNKAPQEAYLRWSKEGPSGEYKLGAIQIISFADGVLVANMLAQHNIKWDGKIPPIRYDALEQCLINAYKHAKNNGLTIAAPRLGADLAGGSWDLIEGIIKKTMTVDTYIYTLESQKDRWPTKYENVDDPKSDAGKKFCKKCGATMFPDDKNDACSTCIGEAQRQGKLPGNGVGGDVSDEDLSQFFKDNMESYE